MKRRRNGFCTHSLAVRPQRHTTAVRAQTSQRSQARAVQLQLLLFTPHSPRVAEIAPEARTNETQRCTMGACVSAPAVRDEDGVQNKPEKSHSLPTSFSTAPSIASKESGRVRSLALDRLKSSSRAALQASFLDKVRLAARHPTGTRARAEPRMTSPPPPQPPRRRPHTRRRPSPPAPHPPPLPYAHTYFNSPNAPRSRACRSSWLW